MSMLIVFGIAYAFSFFMFFRNHRVYKFRRELLNKISELADKDIEDGREWRWRYIEFSKVEYGAQVLRFWKPLDSFYTDKRFYTEE